MLLAQGSGLRTFAQEPWLQTSLHTEGPWAALKTQIPGPALGNRDGLGLEHSLGGGMFLKLPSC